MMRLLIKHLVVIKSEFGTYSKTHKFQILLEELITNSLNKIFYGFTGCYCAEEYRYNFLIDCAGYKQSVNVCDELLAYK